MLLKLQASQNIYFIRLNAVSEEFVFGPAGEIIFDMQTVCLVSILIVLISMRLQRKLF